MLFTGPFDLVFPLVVVGFVPIHSYLLPKSFSTEELELELDLDLKGGGDESSCVDNASRASSRRDDKAELEHHTLPALS